MEIINLFLQVYTLTIGNDIIRINNNLYIEISGLAIYDLVEEQLNNFYDFSFIRNIFNWNKLMNFWYYLQVPV